MAAPQYAILRFAKYKGPEISGIEVHNERTKEKYASNPDIDPTRTHLNFHLIKPERRYRAESEKQIAEAGCRTRSDSVRVVEALITATPEFFKGKKRAEIKEFFSEALKFIKQNQAPETIISAVVHMDEKSPHMHLCFVPLTEDKRLCAKEILGNKKKLTQWQDKYWEHMVKKYPDLERGESASETGRDHIPTRVFKQMARLTKQHDKLEEMLSDVKFTNYKDKTSQIAAFLEKYIPDVAAMETQMKKYEKFFKTASGKQKALEKKNADLADALEESQKQSTSKSCRRQGYKATMSVSRVFLTASRRKSSRLTHRMATENRRYTIIDNRKKDEWSGFADLLANLIEKYAAVLDIDNLPEPPICLDSKENEIVNNSKLFAKSIEKDIVA